MTKVIFNRVYYYKSDVISAVAKDYLTTVQLLSWAWSWGWDRPGVWIVGIEFTHEEDAIAFKLRFQL